MKTLTKSTPSRVDSHAPSCADDALRQSIAAAAHYLPAQGPITAFVHHNTLHAFEELSFEEAVVQGANLFGCHPYMPEDAYREKLARGRISQADIEAVLLDDLGDSADELLGFLGTRFELRANMLRHPLRTGPVAELHWVVAETDALRRFRAESPDSVKERMVDSTRRWVMRDLRNGSAPSPQQSRAKELVDRLFERFDKPGVEAWEESTWESFCLHLLWLVCLGGVSQVAPGAEARGRPVRHRDWLQEATGQDSDELVHEVLIRFSAAFLDQGFGGWPTPETASYFKSFAAVYGQRGGPPTLWLRGLGEELRRIQQTGLTPLDSIAESLELLGVAEAERDQFVTQTLLALKGYAGMLWQAEQRSDRIARPVPPDTLVEFLAVRLILDRLALEHVARTEMSYRGDLASLRDAAEKVGGIRAEAIPGEDQRAFIVFQLAQLIGWSPHALYQLDADGWRTLINEIEAFSRLERRRIYHLAFERQYRTKCLAAVMLHNRWRQCQRSASRAQSATRPAFQVVCCIDEREESFRRHLEEVAPDCETFGAAGFFAVAMYYRGAADAHFTPLCPVIIKPQHYVTESAVYTLQDAERRRRKRRQAIGTVTHQVHVGSRTFAGGWLAGVLGSLASIPLVARILFPRATAQLRRAMGGFVRPPVVTRLQLERSMEPPGPVGDHVGYRLEEMATIVERLLRDIGLTKDFANLVFVFGHGSSSLNNPHESAHDCGACAGGRGGPNARAFAQMANRPDVRALVARNGIAIPRDTTFVGAYHNTCDDNITIYDLDALPPDQRDGFERARELFDEARRRSAHERCRRFESAALNLTPEEALQHVEGRAEDLSQVRPEYGHATNALCFVGRRSWSRGLYLDRRAFLQSYDPTQDDADSSILTRILQAVIPVCAGINLEYYFSFVDPTGYGCGTKLPHNITALLGVMNGAASDLRTGLPWQMVEIHEPVRLLFVIETTPETMLRIVDKNPGIAHLVRGSWVQLAVFDAGTQRVHLYRDGQFESYAPAAGELPEVEWSAQWYRGWRDHLGFARVLRGCAEEGGRA